jgi:hypothetical protein
MSERVKEQFVEVARRFVREWNRHGKPEIEHIAEFKVQFEELLRQLDA